MNLSCSLFQRSKLCFPHKNLPTEIRLFPSVARFFFWRFQKGGGAFSAENPRLQGLVWLWLWVEGLEIGWWTARQLRKAVAMFCVHDALIFFVQAKTKSMSCELQPWQYCVCLQKVKPLILATRLIAKQHVLCALRNGMLHTASGTTKDEIPTNKITEQ